MLYAQSLTIDATLRARVSAETICCRNRITLRSKTQSLIDIANHVHARNGSWDIGDGDNPVEDGVIIIGGVHASTMGPMFGRVQ